MMHIFEVTGIHLLDEQNWQIILLIAVKIFKD